MNDKKLLEQAENFADDMFKEDTPEWASAKAHQSMALSLLVIARHTAGLPNGEEAVTPPSSIPTHLPPPNETRRFRSA